MEKIRIKISETVIKNGMFIKLDKAKVLPEIVINYRALPTGYYTVIMVDPDAPSR